MASGASGRANSGSKVYDFASDDILCSYNDLNNHESSNNSDPGTVAHSIKEFSKSRMARPFSANSYNQPEEYPSQDMISIVENTMKKYTDNLMRFLEGISSRLSQLELYCYNLDKSIGEMRSDLVRDHEEAESKLKFIEKHVQEVHRSVQILRDKQELADTQNELAKIQLAQKESSTTSQSQRSEDRAAATPAPEPKTTDHNSSEVHNQQLALALPHQVAPQPSHVAPQPPPQGPQNVPQPQAQSYYLPQTQLPIPQIQTQSQQGQYMPSDSQYGTPPQVHPYPQYQQWPQQLPQQAQGPSMQPQVRPPMPSSYSPYPPSQPTNPSPEPLPSSVPFQGVPQSRADVMPYGYGVPGRTAQQQPQVPPQHMKNNFTPQPGEGYTAGGPHTSLPPGNSYMMYDNDGGGAGLGPGGRLHHPQQSHFQQGGYPPQPNTNPNQLQRSQSQFVRNHPYNELVEKLVNMGYRGDHVASVIKRLEEGGQTVDFNAVLDRLNGHSSGGSQRGGWSG